MAKKNGFNYFSYFVETAERICGAAALLKNSVEGFEQNSFKDKMLDMHKLENEADMAKHDMMKYLMHEFLPPIEREDIIELGIKLDDIMDTLDDAMRCLYLYNVSEVRPGVFRFCDLIVNIVFVSSFRNLVACLTKCNHTIYLTQIFFKNWSKIQIFI